MARTMGDASKVAVAGGDGSNLYYFYTGSSSYKDNSIENIAAFAQQNFDSCKGKSVEDIESKHIFWGTEGIGFKGFYNGDTYVLFDDIEKLPQDIKQDAYANCKGYRENPKQQDVGPAVGPSEFDPVTIRYIAKGCVEPVDSSKHDNLYRVGISVGKDISENGFANIYTDKNHLDFHGRTWSLHYADNKEIKAQVVRDGQSKRVPLVLSDLATSHDKQIKAQNGKRRLPEVPEGADKGAELQVE